MRYARNGDVRLAYRVLGDGEIPLVLVPGWVSNVDLYEDPAYPFAPMVEQLAPQTRLILWDKRGTGLSDPVTGCRRSMNAWTTFTLSLPRRRSIVRHSWVYQKVGR